MNDTVRIEPSWETQLASEFEEPYFSELLAFVRREYECTRVYPHPREIFKAFDLCPFDQVKVVILGQDPYHGSQQANGLCFSVNEGVAIPPSLQNIYKEIHDDIETVVHNHGNLEAWARQGVLLLNATLTVRAHQAGSHQGKGWEAFTSAAIHALSRERAGIVFMLWGRYAKEKGEGIDREKHLVLEASHPSPLSAHRGFFGCKHFSQANEYLRAKGKKEIEW